MFGFTNLHGAKLRVSILGSTALAFLCFGYDREFFRQYAICRNTWTSDLTLISEGVLGGIIENPQFQAAMHHPSADSLSTITSIYQVSTLNWKNLNVD